VWPVDADRVLAALLLGAGMLLALALFGRGVALAQGLTGSQAGPTPTGAGTSVSEQPARPGRTAADPAGAAPASPELAAMVSLAADPRSPAAWQELPGGWGRGASPPAAVATGPARPEPHGSGRAGTPAPTLAMVSPRDLARGSVSASARPADDAGGDPAAGDPDLAGVGPAAWYWTQPVTHALLKNGVGFGLTQLYGFELGWSVANDILTQAMLRQPWLDDPTANAAVQWLASGALLFGANYRNWQRGIHLFREGKQFDEELYTWRDVLGFASSRDAWGWRNLPAWWLTTGLLLVARGPGRSLLEPYGIPPAPARTSGGRPEWDSLGDYGLNLLYEASTTFVATLLPLSLLPHDPEQNQVYDPGILHRRNPLDLPPTPGRLSTGVGAPRRWFSLGSATVAAAAKVVSEVVANPPPGRWGDEMRRGMRYVSDTVGHLLLTPDADSFVEQWGSRLLNDLQATGILALEMMRQLDPVTGGIRVLLGAGSGVAAALGRQETAAWLASVLEKDVDPTESLNSALAALDRSQRARATAFRLAMAAGGPAAATPLAQAATPLLAQGAPLPGASAAPGVERGRPRLPMDALLLPPTADPTLAQGHGEPVGPAERPRPAAGAAAHAGPPPDAGADERPAGGDPGEGSVVVTVLREPGRWEYHVEEGRLVALDDVEYEGVRLVKGMEIHERTGDVFLNGEYLGNFLHPEPVAAAEAAARDAGTELAADGAPRTPRTQALREPPGTSADPVTPATGVKTGPDAEAGLSDRSAAAPESAAARLDVMPEVHEPAGGLDVADGEGAGGVVPSAVASPGAGG